MSRVALVQLQASIQKDENLRSAIEYIENAKSKKAELVAFPEFLMAYSPSSQTANELANIAESINGEFASVLREAARENGISVVATIYEKSRKIGRAHV